MRQRLTPTAHQPAPAYPLPESVPIPRLEPRCASAFSLRLAPPQHLPTLVQSHCGSSSDARAPCNPPAPTHLPAPSAPTAS
eukprot:2304997-Rhodomonas_salina.5